MKKKLFPLLIILLMWIITDSSGYEATSKEEKTFELKAGGLITVIGDEGYIKIDSWDKKEVHLVMIKHAWARSKREAKERLKKIEIEIEKTDNRLYIRELNSFEDHESSFWDVFDPDRWGDSNGSVSVDFELTVPREIDFRLETDEGDIKVDNINGDLDIDMDEGWLRLRKITFRDINVTIDEGDVDCYDLISNKGRMYLDADEGTIRFENGQINKIKIDCDEGDVFLKNIKVNSCDLETDEGEIMANINIQRNGRYRMYTDEGDVRISLFRDTDLTVKLRTEDGRIDTDFNIDIIEMDDERRAEGKMGTGDAKLEVYTDEGDISLERK